MAEIWRYQWRDQAEGRRLNHIYVLDFDLSSHINLLQSRSNPIQAIRKFLDAIDNVRSSSSVHVKPTAENMCTNFEFWLSNFIGLTLPLKAEVQSAPVHARPTELRCVLVNSYQPTG